MLHHLLSSLGSGLGLFLAQRMRNAHAAAPGVSGRCRRGVARPQGTTAISIVVAAARRYCLATQLPRISSGSIGNAPQGRRRREACHARGCRRTRTHLSAGCQSRTSRPATGIGVSFFLRGTMCVEGVELCSSCGVGNATSARAQNDRSGARRGVLLP